MQMRLLHRKLIKVEKDYDDECLNVWFSLSFVEKKLFVHLKQHHQLNPQSLKSCHVTISSCAT